MFDTAIGICAIAWRDNGRICATAFPGPGLEDGFARRFGVCAPPPPFVQAAIGAIARLLGGERTDLGSIAVDLDASSPFERLVYAGARAIGAGETLTYGELAERIGAPGSAQAVGAALGRNPCPILIPCHRVLGADGRSGGFSAPGGASLKLRLLEIEKARPACADPLLFDHLPWRAKPVSGAFPSGRSTRAR